MHTHTHHHNNNNDDNKSINNDNNNDNHDTNNNNNTINDDRTVPVTWATLGNGAIRWGERESGNINTNIEY